MSIVRHKKARVMTQEWNAYRPISEIHGHDSNSLGTCSRSFMRRFAISKKTMIKMILDDCRDFSESQSIQ